MTLSVYGSEIYVTVETQQVAAVTAVGIQGLSAEGLALDNLTNVDASAKTDGSVLVYKAGTAAWTATLTLEQQNVEGGHY
ncbi:hypothetical protein UFOVP1666_53 [uncultured Caudovirales phage]|uniref:Uncharacterized protein n=1 Tax=uncultured Caudovirales phage TaxID=2100421 RepID=A0A6J5PGW8_9CAUD|nr:hypothetical protein UFOVP867_8 [uncultured Caudovirales phage]CAB4171110.1 hypothetical protein UFOVP913_190 [uncultured Caudovirales phage]CAB4176653.1 hypothetical protein UFOVP993_46 [uncultured Caudovirales phage]CAB4223010.1 hypothetical protein UFOVP1666_53 [uncultured Caudovirales phage]